MRALPILMLLAAVTLPLPVASAGCLVDAYDLCVRDPGTDPCNSVLSCEACFATVPLCVHLDRCLAGDVQACIELEAYCLHSWCPPPWD
jgi:hypothetical protein